MERKFEKGDIVVLKSGGPKMTATTISGKVITRVKTLLYVFGLIQKTKNGKGLLIRKLL